MTNAYNTTEIITRTNPYKYNLLVKPIVSIVHSADCEQRCVQLAATNFIYRGKLSLNSFEARFDEFCVNEKVYCDYKANIYFMHMKS